MIKRFLAEFVGTFFIVFAPLASSFTGKTTFEAAWIAGLAVMVMIYVFGPISAAHFNPAVTLGFATARRFPWRHVLPYVGSQFLGGVAAALVSSILFEPGLVTHIPATDAVFRNVGTEFILSFLLMLVIVSVATDSRVSGTVPALAIGFAVVLCVLVGGQITGGSMNPARSFGPALFGGPTAIEHCWLYLIVPPFGAVSAACIYERLRLSSEHVKGAPDDLLFVQISDD